ncbi:MULTISPECIES: DUF2062 domain-containing protein [unclassified Ruegeria]|uniref:DUF2062 domain-containing protein n=1 Tax=unclassified Ruegeria TaxID=2625375 RepID=UPI001489887B|nr:DUF2062 domain-containing protein [Ruegeria sp. HKCCD6109]NOD78138.1 DUF2062 domain-containing protein [Ruegeria sp. HKCCD4332]NOD90742.1 DUF2062 domain-containing protein [Ruegeria sp. HKCCD4318]NOD94966.1 DUF2062 domain-containing protein [Ruegeria sp. HKCCD4884]NOE15755.1 DUF2062 domain-containing protein [Ruegeria sp. HKCCD4318-2]NOG07972.1 DUF2062 domain-containing protein [Ruegeria sp. HKCCD4315]
MVFKRRDRRSAVQVASEFVYPRGGWTRAFHYVKHRVRRLPDTPDRIARGIGAGVFAAFTPFYGLHFLVAAIGARLIKGNILAALSGTFFGNPLTYVPIGVICLQTGHFLLGTKYEEGDTQGLMGKFADAIGDLKNNFLALFTDRVADWRGLDQFYDDVFFPYMIGGIIPGIVAGVICYYLSLPLILTYQQRRRARIKAKFEEIKRLAEKSTAVPEAKPLGSAAKLKKESRDV